MSERPDFGEVAGKFSEHYDEVRGYVREQVTRHNLDATLQISNPKPKLRIADVGGGDGRDSDWAAGFGHGVVLIEPSAAEIDRVYARHPISGNPAKNNPPPFDIVQADAKAASEI